jgi:NADPH:quinone reductase-like Zn-dependent oxidoreductase
MRVVAVNPESRSIDIVEHDEPEPAAATDVRLRMLEVGVCGTDREIAAFEYGDPPPGSEHLVIGHESLAEVVEVGPGSPHCSLATWWSPWFVGLAPTPPAGHAGRVARISARPVTSASGASSSSTGTWPSSSWTTRTT